MPNSAAHGVIDYDESSKKSDYLYRVSLKGLIRNENGEILVVKETGRSWWDLPGGGMDHGENIKDAIARELHEEVHLTGNFTYAVIAIDEPSLLEKRKAWQLRIIFAVEPDGMEFKPGIDADDVAFIHPNVLKDSNIPVERKIYDYYKLINKYHI